MYIRIEAYIYKIGLYVPKVGLQVSKETHERDL